jgi:signal transduction histidine kinase
MMLRGKTVALLTVVWAILFLTVLGISWGVNRGMLAQYEELALRQEFGRAFNLLLVERNHLAQLATDWADWDDMYDFAATRSPRFAATNLLPTAYADNRLNLVMVCAADWTVIHRFVGDYKAPEKEWNLPGCNVSRLPPEHPLRQAAVRSPNGFAGWLKTCRGVWLLAGRPILKSDGSGSPNGWFMVGRLWDEAEQKQLRNIMLLDLRLAGDDAVPPPLAAAVRPGDGNATPDRPAEHLRFITTANYKKVVAQLPDLLGNNSLSFSVRVDRALNAVAKQSQFVLTVGLLSLALISGVLVLFLVHRTLVCRLEQLKSEVLGIAASGDTGRRVADLGRDEIGILADQINQMLVLIEERKAQEIKAQQANRFEALGLLAGGVAHDFNNVLQGILGHLALAGRRPAVAADTKLGEHLRVIDQAARRGASQVQTLLAFCRQSRTEREPLSLNAAILETRQFIQHPFSETITIDLDLAEPLPLILGNRAQIQHILLNLCLNARDAMPQGGTLTLATRLVTRDGALVVGLTVRDTGHGMNAAVRQQIFDPFFTTKPVGQGTGLGLSIVFGAMRELGGGIECESTPGGGSCFTLWFPACPPF